MKQTNEQTNIGYPCLFTGILRTYRGRVPTLLVAISRSLSKSTCVLFIVGKTEPLVKETMLKIQFNHLGSSINMHIVRYDMTQKPDASLSVYSFY